MLPKQGNPEIDVSLVILGRNCPERAETLISNAKKVLSQSEFDFELLYFNCASHDDSLERLASVHNLAYIPSSSKSSITQTLINGLKTSKGSIVVVHLMGASPRFDYFTNFITHLTDLNAKSLIIGVYPSVPAGPILNTTFLHICGKITHTCWRLLGIDGDLSYRCPIYTMTRPAAELFANYLHPERHSPEVEMTAFAGMAGIDLCSIDVGNFNNKPQLTADFVLKETLEVFTVALLFLFRINQVPNQTGS